jgi:hypothetical protein
MDIEDYCMELYLVLIGWLLWFEGRERIEALSVPDFEVCSFSSHDVKGIVPSFKK